ncbi:hypothetical protein E1H12_08330 [Geitlerinema sp. P-1104]|uniref:hypothetical protein n=1 Tax=Geitlerinema sp. P-1104 TaxID=2546230 RepID=UPI001476C62E|nr:hypothetical protein [Geitlerinema sp. P-1104]NMG58532.1 hypothetical protein [Geitlerinema sp. P-1104]
MGLKALLPLIAIVTGALLPQLAYFSDAIRPLLMALLFTTFINLNLHQVWQNLRPQALWIAIANIGIALAWYALWTPLDVSLGRLYFMTAIAPTAAAAPAVIHLLGRNIEYVTVSVILTNSLVALSLPLLTTWLFEGDRSADPLPMLQSVALLLTIPLLLAQLWKRLPQSWRSPINERGLSLYIWVILLTLASATANDFIRQDNALSALSIAAIALHALIICVVNFSLGRLLGRWLHHGRLAREVSQSLGHKNTMFAVWFILAFLNPSFALGPMFYIVFQNLYNAYQIVTAAKEIPS